jgi:hypothetical protein
MVILAVPASSLANLTSFAVALDVLASSLLVTQLPFATFAFQVVAFASWAGFACSFQVVAFVDILVVASYAIAPFLATTSCLVTFESDFHFDQPLGVEQVVVMDFHS